MVRQEEGCPVGIVMSLEVLHDHVVNSLGRGGVTAGVRHGTSPFLQVIPHDQREFPDTRVGLVRAGRDHTVVGQLVVHRVGEGGRLVVVDGHGGVVGEVCLVQHGEHVVASNGEEGSSDASHILQFDPSKASQDLPLSGHFLHPLLLGELLAEAVRDGVGGDLVAVRVEGLDQGVVRPLVTDVERGGDGTTVGVLPARVKNVLK